MKPSTLIIFAHPAFEKSRANRALVDAVSGLDGVTFHDLYEVYPDFHINIEREKALLESHSRIVWQHPMYWYSTPALFKEWLDVVLEYGWAYGRGGDALRGKTVKSVVTTGGSRDAYCPQGENCYTVQEFLRPLERTAILCGMTYEEPLIIYGALNLQGDALSTAVRTYRDWLDFS